MLFKGQLCSMATFRVQWGIEVLFYSGPVARVSTVEERNNLTSNYTKLPTRPLFSPPRPKDRSFLNYLGVLPKHCYYTPPPTPPTCPHHE